jgi:Cdc6-like AAA superfamily ATPase
MTQTFNRVKESLVALLKDQDYKVIALTGKWGTGKTYLWRSVATEQFGKKTSEQPIYVSLFGVRTISDLKLRILQNTYLKDASSVQNLMKTGSGIFTEVLKKYTGYSAENAALIWLPQLTKGRLIVIDDIERKHKSLDIEEFLGMLDEYAETHNTRFLILLNTDKLVENAGMWSTLHEKVIDAEVVLDPTVSESFEIASKGNTSSYLPEIREAVVILNISNIRVIERIMKTMKRIADSIASVGDVSATRWVPSTALLTACHYRAVENAPPFEYIKSFNQFGHWSDDKNDTKRDPKEMDWDLLLNKLGISSIDTYEEIMQQFLQSGLLDIDRLKELFERYKKEEANSVAFEKQRAFLKAFWWDAHCSEGDLLAMAKELLPFMNVFGPDSISDIVSVVEKLGDVVLARQLLDAWLLSIDSRPEYQELGEEIFDTSLRNYHPDVVKKMNSVRDMQHPLLTVLETADRIISNSGWGDRERISLYNSTVQNYEDALKQITGTQLRRFLSLHLEWARRAIPYDDNFKIGTDNFIAACINICFSTPDSRLSKIIYRTFEANSLAEKLEPSTLVSKSELNLPPKIVDKTN